MNKKILFLDDDPPVMKDEGMGSIEELVLQVLGWRIVESDD